MRKRTFDKEYKIQAVEGCLEGDKFLAQVAKELGLSYNTLHRWVKEYKESNGKSFVGSGNTSRKIKKSSNFAAAIKS